jgi:hypothetical protein
MLIIFSVRHPARPIEDFIETLSQHAITQLVDIRSIPKSRHNPQFEQRKLEKSLVHGSIKYVYLNELGGLRSTVKFSTNSAWRNRAFKTRPITYRPRDEELAKVTHRTVSTGNDG